ncbi:MAG: DEAD/DEAH box helicase family protein [Candidatus Methanomethyliaceae archaeon]|nr:DEAD/DEAH box helicase family protein [Candidatus Methanomethyliaceae archaeon]
MPVEGWKRYLEFLDSSPYSMQLLTSNLAPECPIEELQSVKVERINYQLFPFQQKILDRISGNALVVGLPTGLGKTYVAGAFIARESAIRPCRVLFLTPSVPLGVQQTLFARQMLNLRDAFFISGSIPPEKRRALKVWNAGFAVTTPQTFYNDVLSQFSSMIGAAKKSEDEPIENLAVALNESKFAFPYNLVIADECHGYIGETNGYSILLAAKACGSQILALSATPQLHAPERLHELKKVFGQIEVFSVEEPEIKVHMPERVIALIPVYANPKLLAVYAQLQEVSNIYQERVRKRYGPQHLRGYCKNRSHMLCICLLALRIMKFRIVEDGASSVRNYGIWKLRELNSSKKELGGKSVYETYQELLKLESNHKISAALKILSRREFSKAIVFVESVEAAKQMGMMLQREYGVEKVAVLVGKGGMTMEQQASALLQFKDKASILVCTSIGEEGLDVPVADIEIWIDPPSNPKKWIQRFGRILRQTGGKKTAKTYALISMKTHEKNKLLGTKKRVERVYGFTQNLVEEDLPKSPVKGQRSLSQYMMKGSDDISK